jgi:hypothetical protein
LYKLPRGEDAKFARNKLDSVVLSALELLLFIKEFVKSVITTVLYQFFKNKFHDLIFFLSQQKKPNVTNYPGKGYVELK